MTQTFLTRWGRNHWRPLWWPMCWILLQLPLLRAFSIFRQRLFPLNFLIGALGLLQVCFRPFNGILLLQLFIKNGFYRPFSFDFFLWTILIILKCLMETLVISTRLYIIEKSRVDCDYALAIKLVVEAHQTIGAVSFSIAFWERSGGLVGRLTVQRTLFLENALSIVIFFVW